MSSKQRVIAIIGAVVRAVPAGRKPFVVAYPDDSDLRFKRGASITFALCKWNGEEDPRPGQMAELGGIEQFMRGWRASSARPVTLDDSKEQQEVGEHQ